jgi:hypothetical protein
MMQTLLLGTKKSNAGVRHFSHHHPGGEYTADNLQETHGTYRWLTRRRVS